MGRICDVYRSPRLGMIGMRNSQYGYRLCTVSDKPLPLGLACRLLSYWSVRGEDALAAILGMFGIHARAPGWSRGRTRLLHAEGGLSVLLLEVAASPDAGTDPDGKNSNNHDNEENDPLPVVGEPTTCQCLQGFQVAPIHDLPVSTLWVCRSLSC